MSGNKKVDFNDSVPAPPTDMVNIHFQKETIDADNAKISAYVDPADLPSGGGGGGASSFDELNGGTNTTAAMVVGTGASLTRSGSGHIDADKINGVPITGTPDLGKIPIGQGDGTAVFADPLVQGLVAEGAPVPNPVVVGGKDGSGNAKTLVLDSSGRPTVNVNGTVTVSGPLTDAQLRATPVPISGSVTASDPTSLPLPTGAATAANQASAGTSLTSIDSKLTGVALDGTDGTAPPSVLGGGTGIRGWLRSIYEKLTNSIAVTVASLPLPSGASTAAKQPALGVAGTASTDVITIQGIASMTKLLVTPDSVALPANQSVNVAQINGVAPLMGAGNTGTGSPRVTIASDQAVIPVKSSPQTSGGLSIASGSIQATATTIKASAGQLFLLDIFNINTAPIYVQIFNKLIANVTLGTTAPDASIGIPAGGGKVISAADIGIAFGTGIAIAMTTTRTGNTNPSSGVDYNAFYA